MKLGDLLPAEYSINYGEAVLHMRYDLAAFLQIEGTGLDYSTVFERKITKSALCVFVQAGVREDIGRERIRAMVNAAPQEMWMHCRNAVLLSLPEYDPLTIPEHTTAKKSAGIDWKRLRILFCDELHKPEEMFWQSTVREITERWTIYATAKGYIKEPEKAVRLKDMTQEEALECLKAQGI